MTDATATTTIPPRRPRGRPRANPDARTTAAAKPNHHSRAAVPKLSSLVRGMGRKIDQMGEEIRDLRRSLS